MTQRYLRMDRMAHFFDDLGEFGDLGDVGGVGGDVGDGGDVMPFSTSPFDVFGSVFSTPLGVVLSFDLPLFGTTSATSAWDPRLDRTGNGMFW